MKKTVTSGKLWNHGQGAAGVLGAVFATLQ
jgi:hypothetical protein